MKARFPLSLRVLTNLPLVMLVGFVFPATGSAQLVSRDPGGPPACTASDKVEVASFTVTPAAPRVGDTVRAVLKIKNKCPGGTADLNVPWNIVRSPQSGGTEIVASGTVTLAAGAISGELSGVWKAVAGAFNFYGNADPPPQYRISETNRANNTSADTWVTPWRQQILTMSAGGSFPLNPETPQGTCALINNQMSDGQIQSILNCNVSATGLKANPEYFKDLTLKNNWVVDYSLVRFEAVISGSGRGGWSWRVQPASGSNSPRAQIHLWVDALTSYQIYLTIGIKGPAHLSPF